MAFLVVSASVQRECAEAGRSQGVVATYTVPDGCTAPGVFGVRFSVDMASRL